jgi:3-deoxy-D-manno-octulosonate 8-phosphate phosphatase (KDO 8-P phosphatase)
MPPRLLTDSQVAAPITCLLSDVDGVMTDGRIIYDSAGEETKQFHVRDGLGIKLWMASGFHFGIITSRESPVVSRRAKELGIHHVAQAAQTKRLAAERMIAAMECQWHQVAYIGDDLPDLDVMRQAGLAVAPADAAQDVCHAAHWILQASGGDGAVRELIERLLRAKQRWEQHLSPEG